MVNISWVGILFFFVCINFGFYAIGQHLSAIGDPLATTFGATVVDYELYNSTNPNDRSTLYGNATNLGNYTSGGTGQPFDIFDQAPENVIQGGYTLWQGLPIGNAFTTIGNLFTLMGVSLPWFNAGIANIFAVAFVIFSIYMIAGRQPS